MTILYLTRRNDKTVTPSDTSSQRFSRELILGNHWEHLSPRVTTQDDPLENLSTDCLVCGGYLPRRKRIGGLHQLCQHYYDEQGHN